MTPGSPLLYLLYASGQSQSVASNDADALVGLTEVFAAPRYTDVHELQKEALWSMDSSMSLPIERE